jgi:hypothetical protein
MSPRQGKGQSRRALARFGIASGFAALLLAGTASPAPAAVTIGQLDPGTPSTSCSNNRDILQGNLSSGNSYVVPGTGTITSWSTNGEAGAGQLLAMKVFRKVGDPFIYQVVGHDGPRSLSAGGGLQTFPAGIPVRPGDLLGVSTTPASGGPSCAFPTSPADVLRALAGNLADGQSGDFSPSQAGFRLNVTAVFDPSNTFTLGKTTLNKKKGTATITATVPNPGDLTASGKGVKRSSSAGARTAVSVAAPGTVKLKIRAKGKKKATLNDVGKVKVKPKITYTPTGGTAATQSRKVKLKKNL